MPDQPGAFERIVERARRVLTQDWPYGAVWAMHHAGGAYPHYAERADGARFWDVTGREYLDWFLGGGVITLGHRHPAVQRAMAEQMERGVHLSLPSVLEVEVAERLCTLFPGAEQVAFGKNGTDVTSAAVRLARAVTGREHVLISGYHGWQDWSKAVSPEVTGIPQALRGLVHEFGYNDLSGAAERMARLGSQVAAIVVEPLRYADLATDFLPGLRELADRHGCLLVFDEIVTGFRVARGGVQELSGVRPDLTCLAKSLANGLPLAALLGPRRWMRHLPPTFFGLTYQREALSLAAARASLDVHREVDVAGHLARLGELLRARFAAAAAGHGLSWALDGHPAMLHLRLTGAGRLTTRGAEALFVECCQRAGVYVQLHRLLPSLAHGEADVERTARVFAEAMGTVREAMDHGLGGYLDSPVWDGMETAASREEPARRAVPLAVGPWLRATGGVTATVTPEAAEAGIATRDGRPVLQVRSGLRGETVACSIELSTPLLGDLRVAARYRWDAWQPGNATALAALALGGAEGAWCEVQHVTSFGQMPRSAASLAGRYAAVACAYDTRAGILILQRRGATVTAWHDTGEPLALLAMPMAVVPMRVRFELRVVGATHGAVAVELVDLAVTEGDQPWRELDAQLAQAVELLAAGQAERASTLLVAALLLPAADCWPSAERAFLVLEQAWRALADVVQARQSLAALAVLHERQAGFLALWAAVEEATGHRALAHQLAARGLRARGAGAAAHARLNALLGGTA